MIGKITENVREAKNVGLGRNPGPFLIRTL